MPHAVFVDPEVASVGLTRRQALDAGLDVAIGTQAFTGIAKAKATGDTRGHITFVTDPSSDQILGCHIVGRDAGNLIHEAVIAMTAGLPASTIADTILLSCGPNGCPASDWGACRSKHQLQDLLPGRGT